MPRALDIGCGAGDLTKLLLDHAEKIDGVDLSPGLIAKAKAKDELTNITFHCSNFLDYNPTEHYDFISAIWFHHQLNSREEQEKTRIKISQLLNQQGKFVFLIPSATYPGARASAFLKALNFFHVIIDSCPEYDQMLFPFNNTEWEKYTAWRPLYLYELYKDHFDMNFVDTKKIMVDNDYLTPAYINPLFDILIGEKK
ncbi:MAG: class I SAM-dependent methyltransferase [Gammaproteobacteria bacterium]|nr:class I SAM-dependent methyltransferase [Gammaproteobacteria bacterium]